MKKLGKVLSLMFALTLAVTSLTACGKKAKEDWDYIEEKGTLVIGYTLFQPMNYKEGDKLVGFDTELAEAVCAELGLTPEFVEINWDTKVNEIKAKSIDVIWNGMTITEQLGKEIDFSTPYMMNKQAVIVKKDRLAEFATIEDVAAVKICAELKSAGEKEILANDVLKTADYTAVALQRDVLMEVKSGTSDAGVIDYTMAKAMLRDGTDYNDLIIIEDIELAKEEYAIGFRKDSKVTVEKVNAALKTLAENGTIDTLAAKYELADSISEELK